MRRRFLVCSIVSLILSVALYFVVYGGGRNVHLPDPFPTIIFLFPPLLNLLGLVLAIIGVVRAAKKEEGKLSYIILAVLNITAVLLAYCMILMKELSSI